MLKDASPYLTTKIPSHSLKFNSQNGQPIEEIYLLIIHFYSALFPVGATQSYRVYQDVEMAKETHLVPSKKDLLYFHKKGCKNIHLNEKEKQSLKFGQGGRKFGRK